MWSCHDHVLQHIIREFHYINLNIFSSQIFIKEVVNNGEDVQKDEVTNPEPANQRTLEQTGASQHGLLLGSNHSETDVLPAVPEASLKPTRNGNTNEAPKVTLFSIQYNIKIQKK